MPSSPILDIEALLAPIPGENPAGEYLLYAGSYEAIKEARRADDTLERGEWAQEIKTANWPVVIDKATDALATKTKDLQIAVWLVEAVVQQHHLPGLRDGLRLLCGLQEQFWESLYPAMEDGDVDARILPVEFLNRTLPLLVRQIVLTQGEGYSWLRWKESRDVDNLGRQNPQAQAQALAEGKITGEQFDKAVEATSRAFCEALFADFQQCWEEYQRLDQVLEEKFGREAPSLLDVKKAIEECRTLLDNILKKKRELEPDPPPAETEASDELAVGFADGEDFIPSVASGPRRAPLTTRGGGVPLEPQDRTDALRRLAAVAEYFRKTEPHSPIAYLVERAVRWGPMSLDEWLREVVGDESVLTHLLRETLGLRKTEENS